MSRLSHLTLCCCPLLILAACANTSETPSAEAGGAAQVEEGSQDQQAPPEPVSLEGWRSERIELPPAFAPELPGGEELLLFAPGMFDAQAEDYWSYAFVMRIDEEEIDAARLTELLELYYDGLLQAVARSSSDTANYVDDPAQVKVEHVSPGSFEANIHLIDSFVTFQPIDVRLLVESEPGSPSGTFMRIQASPQHAVWRQLAGASASFEL